jgi:hypothetical protein
MLRQAARAKGLDEVHEANFVLYHSCIGPADPALAWCSCRKYISLAQAREMANRGEIVDFGTRASYFFGKGRDVLTSSRLKHTPRSATIEKSHILRGTNYTRIRTPEEAAGDYQALQTRIAADKADRFEEERLRWGVWAELTSEFFMSLTKVYSPEQWAAEEARQKTIPNLSCGIGHDERTNSVDYQSQREQYMQSPALEDVAHTPADEVAVEVSEDADLVEIEVRTEDDIVEDDDTVEPYEVEDETESEEAAA